MKKLTALLLAAALFLTACGTPASSSTNLIESLPARVICLAEFSDRSAEVTDFSLRLFRNSLTDGKNTLISPLSVLAALGMTMNGAQGDTLTQMETTLGLPTRDVNTFLYSSMDGQNDTLKLANSIWLKNTPTLSVEPNFLETNADFYQADVFESPFDNSTLTDINRWVSEKTDGMIPEILDTIPASAVLYLINALSFDARWESIYHDFNVWENTFTTEDGREQTVEFMSSTEYAYLEDANATGFLKYYEGRRYAFAALLPNEGTTVSDYAATLTGEHLRALLSAPQQVATHASLPKFETEYSTDLSDILPAMGMTDAFDVEKADFSKMASSESGNICISRILHKTHISVAEEGTKAGAATLTEMEAGAALIQDYKTVTLDRPFLYLLIDCDQSFPIFIGTLMELE